eukprot:scaffold246584_cov32-Tisochrysis_lutea.AAC.1
MPRALWWTKSLPPSFKIDLITSIWPTFAASIQRVPTLPPEGRRPAAPAVVGDTEEDVVAAVVVGGASTFALDMRLLAWLEASDVAFGSDVTSPCRSIVRRLSRP